MLVTAYLLDNGVIDTIDAFVDVETQGLCEGASVVYPVMKYKDKMKNCEVAVNADTGRFFEIFFGYLFPEYLDTVKKMQG